MAQGDEVSVSVDEAARRLGLSKRTVWRLIAADKLKVFRPGGRTLVPVIELNNYVARETRGDVA